MRDQQLFAVIAAVALLLLLVSGLRLPAAYRRMAMLAAVAVVGLGLLWAVVQSVIHFTR